MASRNRLYVWRGFCFINVSLFQAQLGRLPLVDQLQLLLLP